MVDEKRVATKRGQPTFQLLRAFSFFSKSALRAATGDLELATIVAASSANGERSESPAVELVTESSFEEKRLCGDVWMNESLFDNAHSQTPQRTESLR